MSMALFQFNVMCTEPNEVTSYETQYLQYKENGHCYKCTNTSHIKTGNCVTLYFLNGNIYVKNVLTAERSGHFSPSLDFSVTHSCCGHIFKELFMM